MPAESFPEPELSDQDILAAMRQIPGYLDVSTGDFREIYHLAHRQALARMFGSVRAADLMRTGIEPLDPETPLDQAARLLVRQGLKGLPVVAGGRVVGMLTETDYLRRLGVDSFLELLIRLLDGVGLQQRCRETPVRLAMVTPVVTVPEEAGFAAILAAFQTHAGRSMPVVDAAGALRGLLLRKDFVGVWPRGAR